MVIVQLVIAVLFAVAGHQEARRFARQYGRTPWGWDPWVWAIVLGVSFIVGIVLLAIAERRGRAHGSAATTTTHTTPAYGVTILPRG